MIDFSQNYFALFGLPQRYGFDPEQLDAAYRALQRVVHPDRYAAAGDAERRVALQSSARVNEAYRALKDPVGRAQYRHSGGQRRDCGFYRCRLSGRRRLALLFDP